MKFHELKVSSHATSKRLGRGIASGKGKTAGRGTKGQGARTGSKARPGFTGGQNPMMQQLPKLPGFNQHRPKAENVYTGQLNKFSGKTIDNAVLSEAGIVSSPYTRVKLIARGELTKKVTVKLQAASAGAVAAVEAAGGSFEAVARAQRPASKAKTEEKA